MNIESIIGALAAIALVVWAVFFTKGDGDVY